MQATQLPLKDIHLPEAISWWPPALGWWLLVLLIPLLVIGLIVCYRRLTRKTALKAAKRILANIKHDSGKDNFQKLCELSVLLRRVAISMSPTSNVASLTGAEWLSFLDRSLPDSPFSEGIGACLATGPYQQLLLADNEIAQLTSLCEDWLKAQTKYKSQRQPVEKTR